MRQRRLLFLAGVALVAAAIAVFYVPKGGGEWWGGESLQDC